MAHHWSEGVGVLRFTPREYEQELVEAGGAGGLLACPPQPAARFVALKVLQELAWQIRSPNIRKTVLLVPPRRLKTVALEISLLTDLKAVVVGDFVDEQTWRDCVENNQVLVVTSSILDDLLQRGVLTMVMINLLVIEDCHSVASDPHLQRIITSYKSYKQRVHGTDDVIPKVVAFTHPLFSQEFLLDDESKNSDKQSNTIDTDSEYASSENEEIEDDNENKPTDALEYFTETVISEQELNEDWQKMTDFNYWRRDFEDIDLNLPAIEPTSAERAVKDEENECSSEALSQANTVSDVAVNSRSERCFATDSEREPSVRRSVYDKLECQLEKLESMIVCKADMASDVAGLKKITGKPREVILECPQTSPGSEEGKKLEDFMKKVVSGAMVFLKDHRYDPTEIYGDEAFGEELRAIPNPCVEPVVMLQQFLYVLDQSGPYGADKAAFSLLVRIEKLKVKIPYERHFLLLCLVTSVFLQIRAAAELVFQKYPNELERIQRFTRPRFLRMMEIFKIFKPESADKTVDNSPMNFPLRGSNLQNDLKQQCDNGSLTTEERIDSFVLKNEENVLNVSDRCEKYIPELNNKVEIVLDNDSIQILIQSGDPHVLLNETDGSLVCDSLPENDASQDSIIRDSLLAVDAGSQCGESGVTEVLQELERCDFKRLGRKIEEKSEEIKFTSFGVKRHSCDSGDTEARKKMKCSDCETTASDATELAQKFAEETKEDSCSLETEEVVIETKENIVNVHPSISKISLESGTKDSLNLADGEVCLAEKPTTQIIDNLGGVKVELSDSEESTLNTENVILKAMCSSGMMKNKEDVGSRDSSKDSSSHEKLDRVFETCGSKAILAGVIDPGRMSEAEFEDRQICYNRPSEDRGASGFSPRKRVWEGGKKGKGKGVRGNYHRNYGWNDPDALCGLVFVDEPLMAKILCALINEYCRSCPELLFVFPQYTVDKMVDPLTDPREAEIEHKRQEEVLKRFRTHECNLLIGTAVLEDGMDLPKCNLVVRWDPPRGYRSYAACRARARAPKSLYALMAPKNPGKLVTALAQYAQIEKMLIRKCSWNEPGPTEEAHAGRFTPLVEAYRPSAQAVSLAQAVQLLNRYCAKLPSDSFTRLVPLWTTEPLVYRDKVLFVCSIRLPINCPLKCQIVGHPMPTRVLARRIAALQVCRALHMSGELDDNLLPIGKENFRALDPDWLSLPPTSDIQSILDGSVEARPGTTKRKQYYYKKVARSLSDCRPALGRPCLAYEVRALLAVPLPERHNTRGRKLHPPQAYKEGFAILTDRPIHQIPTFPMFTRSGEVQVNLERMKVRVVLNAHRERMVHRFMRYTFTEVLRVHNHLMVFDSKGRQKRNSYYVVPTTKVFSPDGSTSVAIDWKFLELIYSQTENVAKETILKTLHENIEHVQDLDDCKASYECDADEYVAMCSKNESDQLKAPESVKDHENNHEKHNQCDLTDSRKDIPSESTSKDDNVVVVEDVNSDVDIKEEENQQEHDIDQKDEKCIKLNEDTDDLDKAPKYDAEVEPTITVDANETDCAQTVVAEVEPTITVDANETDCAQTVVAEVEPTITVDANETDCAQTVVAEVEPTITVDANETDCAQTVVAEVEPTITVDANETDCAQTVVAEVEPTITVDANETDCAQTVVAEVEPTITVDANETDCAQTIVAEVEPTITVDANETDCAQTVVAEVEQTITVDANEKDCAQTVVAEVEPTITVDANETDCAQTIVAEVEPTITVDANEADCAQIIVAEVESTITVDANETDCAQTIVAEVEPTITVDANETDCAQIIVAEVEPTITVDVNETDRAQTIVAEVEPTITVDANETDCAQTIVAEVEQTITVDANETDRAQTIVAESDDASKKGEVDDGEIAIEASGDVPDTEQAVAKVEPVVEELEEMPNPYLAQGEVFVFDNEKYRDAVVMPWYRNQDQPQYFYVAEICWHLSPLSAFPSSQHSTFEDYYRSKYGVRITQPHQPLLDVDHTSARLNLLTPRFVNRKGVALPTSSERTKKAKRESLDQKQILVPELCHTHPFRGALWRAAVALPCVLYRINSLLLADEIRRSVALVVALGRPRLKPDFRWPPLDFGWSLADVLREEGAAKQDGALFEAPKPEGEVKQLTERGATSEDATDEGGEKTANDIIAEKEEADKGESGDVFEVGMWSNEMAAAVPAPVDCGEERDDETVAASKLPGNITMCPSQGGADWSLATSPRRQNHQRKYSVADSDASYVSSEFDVSGDEAATSDEETDDEDDDKTAETSEPVTEKGGIRIEFKSGNEAEAIEVAPAALKPLAEDPADVEQQLVEERNATEAFGRFFYGRDDEDDEVTRASVEKFQRAIEFNEVDILKNGVLIPCGQSVESIKMQDFSETIPFHNHQNNVQMFGARGVIKHWKAGISTESDDSIVDSNIKPGSVEKSTDLNDERNKRNLESSIEKVVQHFRYNSQLDSSDVKPNESDRSVEESTEFDTTKYTGDLVVDLRDVDDDRTNPFQEVFEMALSKSEIGELFREMFPYEDGRLDGVDSEDGLLKNGRVTLEDLESNKRRILNEIKESMPKEEWRKYNFFSLKDFDDEHFENEYSDIVSQRKSLNDSENENLVAEAGKQLNSDRTAFETDLEQMSSAKGSAVVKNTKCVDKNTDFNINFSFDYQPDLSSHPGPSPSVILQALTMSNANDGINLERLETIGDSFLKYAITTYLYCTYQNIHEGKLSHLRSKQVSNLNLYRLGRSRALGGRMVASKFEPHDNWLPPCHRVPPHLERALIDTHIPSTLWNVAEMPSLENMSREQIEKLVKEKVAQHHSKPPRGAASDDNKRDNNSGVIRQIVNTDCPVHGALRASKSQIASADSKKMDIVDFEELTETIDQADDIEAKTVEIDIQNVDSEVNSIAQEMNVETGLILKSETKMVEIQSVVEDGESSPKEEKPSNDKLESDTTVAQSVSESSDEDSDDDDASKPDTGRGASLKERYRGYLESGLGRQCACSLVQTPVGVAESAHKTAAAEVPEDVPCFVPYNLITQHSIPDKSVADCVEALIGAYLIECGPRGALLFMAWLGIRVLPKEEVVLNLEHPFVKIMEEASLKSNGKTVSEGTVRDAGREIEETNESAVKMTDKNTIDDKREICIDGKVTEVGNVDDVIKDLEPINEESVESKGKVCIFNPRKKSKRPRKRRNKNRKKEESDRTADESWESIEESLPSPEVKCFEDDTKPITESPMPIRECELVKKSDTVEAMCSKMAKMEKYNVLPKFVDEMDFWCGDEPIDEDSCGEDDVDYPTRCDEEPDEEASEKDPYDSEDDESVLEDDWNWDGRIPGSLKPQKDDQGRWVQVVFGELKPPPSPLLRNVPDPEGELMQMLSGYDSLERTLGYRFRDRCYLLQAMTHASHSSNRLTDCYQRLEFLGDAVLDYLITRQLYEDPRRHSPGALTDLRSALVNNTIFASLAVRHGMHKYFRHLSPGLDEVLARFVKIQEENGHSISEEHYLIQEDECEQAEDVEVPKALGDLFESVAGAIFLDSGMSLDAVWRVYHSLMQREMEMFSETVPKSPVRELLEMEPETAKFGKPEKLADGRRVRVTVEVLGAGAFKGVGRNYRIAKCTAAKCALRHLNSPRAKGAGARK